MMADFVVPRHSAVMERLRRRIELFRRHHTSCENRYDNTAMERLEMERQQTFALHQRCLQTKAKRSSKHRQPTSDQAVQRGSGTGGNNADLGDGGTSEQSRNSTLIAVSDHFRKWMQMHHKSDNSFMAVILFAHSCVKLVIFMCSDCKSRKEHYLLSFAVCSMCSDCHIRVVASILCAFWVAAVTCSHCCPAVFTRQPLACWGTMFTIPQFFYCGETNFSVILVQT